MKSDLRILVVDVAIDSMNPIRRLLPRLFSLVGNTHFFGPGYVSHDVLQKGLDAFMQNNGPFDIAVITDQYLFLGQDVPEKVINGYRRNNVCKFPLSNLHFCPGIRDQFLKLSIFKAAFVFTDYYNMPTSDVEKLSDRFDLIIGSGEQFFRTVTSSFEGGAASESFSRFANDNWLNFIKKNQHRAISFPFFLADDEFDFSPLAHRAANWCVPGTPYDARIRARTILVKNKSSIGRGRSVFHLQTLAAILTRLGVPLYASPTFLGFYGQLFRREIADSRFAFTCGSAFGYPVRKFFEIPALGTILVCSACNGFEALGFRDGVNAIVCQPEDLVALEKRLISNPEMAQSIASEGRKLIGERHTVEVRAAQLRMAFTKALKGDWHGAEWRDGELIPFDSEVGLSPPGLAMPFSNISEKTSLEKNCDYV